jgi:hypothetical protein
MFDQRVFRTSVSPRRLSPDCNPALYPAADRYGTTRNHPLIVVALHSGFRAEQLCKLKPHRVKLGKRSGHLKAYGKRGKYREAPINVTVRAALAERMEELPGGVSSSWLWPCTRARKSQRRREG